MNMSSHPSDKNHIFMIFPFLDERTSSFVVFCFPVIQIFHITFFQKMFSLFNHG
uniref:Uncharacterized protein n=1 Tax=Anguilla anguilla TaxID=7936 RepID=A0A0E9Q313_ANGAN